MGDISYRQLQAECTDNSERFLDFARNDKTPEPLRKRAEVPILRMLELSG